MKRFAALLFILTLAGTVWAGICDCIDGSDSHSASKCCKRDRADKPSVSKKPCCGDECGPSMQTGVHRTQSESSVKLPIPARLTNIGFDLYGIDLSRLDSLDGDPSGPQNYRPDLPRPPDLYIKHNSLLI